MERVRYIYKQMFTFRLKIIHINMKHFNKIFNEKTELFIPISETQNYCL